MTDTLIRRINALIGLRVPRPSLPPADEPPATWVLPDSGVRARVVIPDARPLLERQLRIIYTQSIVIAALLVALFGALSALRWR